MNERFKELREQATIRGHDDGIIYVDDEMLAELIVRECAQVCEDDITDGDACCTNTADRIARQIKKHFGVES